MTTHLDKVPLKTILLNFVNHVYTLDCKLIEGEDLYEKEFFELKFISETLKTQPSFSCSEGEKDVNRRKNRYKDILPFDYTRVTLSPFPGIPGSDYINANYVKGASGSPAYIASQGPLPHTVADFWRMVVECEVQVIIMACNETESGKHKCECYWPEDIGQDRSFGPYSIRLLDSRQIGSDFCLRKLELTYTDSKGLRTSRTIAQFHYYAWPDHGVPTQVRPLLEMVRWVRDCQASETLPLLVHCSAGCGRTGTICALDYVWGLLRAGKLSTDFSLFELVRDMRRQRIAMVQTKEQYILVHRAVRDLFLNQLKVIESHPYENLDVHGRPRAEEKEEPAYENICLNGEFQETKTTALPPPTDPPPLPERKRESLSPPSKVYITPARSPVRRRRNDSIEALPNLAPAQSPTRSRRNGILDEISNLAPSQSPSRHARNDSMDALLNVGLVPTIQTPGSSYEELSAIVNIFKAKSPSPVPPPGETELCSKRDAETNFCRLNFVSTSPELKHSRTKPSDVKAKSKSAKISSVVKRSKSLKVPSTITSIKVKPTSPILERRYIVPSLSEVVSERSFVRPEKESNRGSRFYVELRSAKENNLESLESRDCEIETVSVRAPQMLKFPKPVSTSVLEVPKHQKFSSVSPTLLRKPLLEKVNLARKQASLSPALSRKQMGAPDAVTASLDRYRDVRKSQTNLNAGSSQFSGLVGSIDRSADQVRPKVAPRVPGKFPVAVPLSVCHVNATTINTGGSSEKLRDNNAQSHENLNEGVIPITVLSINDRCDFVNAFEHDAPVPIVLKVKCESSGMGDYDNVEKCASKNVPRKYEKVWLTTDSEPLYANLPLKKSVSMKEIKPKPDLSGDQAYFVQKSDEIAKLLRDLKYHTKKEEKASPTSSDGPMRSRSEDYLSSPPFREPPSYEAVISSKLYKEKLSRIADLAESKERQQRKLGRIEGGPVAPPRAKRNGSFNEPGPKWSGGSKESSPLSFSRKPDESRVPTPKAFSPPIPSRSESFVATAAVSPESGTSSVENSSGKGSPKSQPYTVFLKPDPPIRANAAAQAANRAFQKALSRFQATASQLKSKLIHLKDPPASVDGEDNMSCTDQGWNDFSIFQRNIMPRVNPTNHVREILGYYAYHAPECGHIYEDVIPPTDSVPVLKYVKKQEYL